VQADLTDIYTYIALDDPAAAERFVDGLVCQMYKIADLGLSESPRGCRWAQPSAAVGSLRSI
jgi:plasmid stabilization system protein ParE